MAFMGKERNIGAAQKPGIDLQGVEDIATQAKIKELEVQLHSKEQEKSEIKRNMDRAIAQLTNRIWRLEDQLKNIPSSTGGSNEVSSLACTYRCNCFVFSIPCRLLWLKRYAS